MGAVRPDWPWTSSCFVYFLKFRLVAFSLHPFTWKNGNEIIQFQFHGIESNQTESKWVEPHHLQSESRYFCSIAFNFDCEHHEIINFFLLDFMSSITGPTRAREQPFIDRDHFFDDPFFFSFCLSSSAHLHFIFWPLLVSVFYPNVWRASLMCNRQPYQHFLIYSLNAKVYAAW